MDARIVEEWGRLDPVGHAIETCIVDPNNYPSNRSPDWTEPQRIVHVAGWCHFVIWHTGWRSIHEQGFQTLLPEAATATKNIGATKWHDHFRLGAQISDPASGPHLNPLGQQNDGDTGERYLASLDEAFWILEEQQPLESHLRRFVEANLTEFYRPAADEETAANILLQIAQRQFNTPDADYDIARQLLEEAAHRSTKGGTGRTASLTTTLLEQIPLLQPQQSTPESKSPQPDR